MTIEAGKTYFFTKSGNEVRAVAPTTPYRGLAMWEVERTTGASAGKRMHNSETRAELLPTKRLAERWVEMLSASRNEHDRAQRDSNFRFAHGWLAGLVDAGVLNVTVKPDLIELLIAA